MRQLIDTFSSASSRNKLSDETIIVSSSRENYLTQKALVFLNFKSFMRLKQGYTVIKSEGLEIVISRVTTIIKLNLIKLSQIEYYTRRYHQ